MKNQPLQNSPTSSYLVKTKKSKQEVVSLIVSSLQKRNIPSTAQGDTVTGGYTANYIDVTYSLSVNDREGGFAIDRILQIKQSKKFLFTMYAAIFLGVGLLVICVGLFILLLGTKAIGAALKTEADSTQANFDEAMQMIKQECEM